MNKKFTLGRGVTCDFKIENTSVSNVHAMITILANNQIMIEDNNSTNGTYLNGQRVLRVTAQLDDVLKFGNYEVVVNKLIGQFLNLSGSDVPPKIGGATPPPLPNQFQTVSSRQQTTFSNPQKQGNPIDVSEEFEMLKTTYEDYRTAKRRIRHNPNMNAMKAALSFVPGVIHLMSAKFSVDDKLDELDDWFKKTYKCPNCQEFFGHNHWEEIAAKKKCKFCKAILVK